MCASCCLVWHSIKLGHVAVLKPAGHEPSLQETHTPFHTSSDVVQETLSILILSGQCMLDNKLPFIKSERLVQMNNLSFATFCVLCILLALCSTCSAAVLTQDVSCCEKHKQSQIPFASNQTASKEQRSGSETDLCLVYRLSGSTTSSNCSFAGCLMRQPAQGLETLTPRIALIGSDMLCGRSIGSGDAFRLGRVSQSFLCFTSRQESKPLLRRHGACCINVPLQLGLATVQDATCRAGAEVLVRLLRLKAQVLNEIQALEPQL